MTIIGLDLSSKTGVSIFDCEEDFSNHELIEAFRFEQKTPIKTKHKTTPVHPYDFVEWVEQYTKKLIESIIDEDPDLIVIEQTNKSRNRWTQKLLEFQHYQLALSLRELAIPVQYIDTITWRKTLQIKLSKEERKHNREISKFNKDNKELIKNKLVTLARGKRTAKHLSVEFAKQKYGLDNIKIKDNDIADAICIAEAYIQLKQKEVK